MLRQFFPILIQPPPIGIEGDNRIGNDRAPIRVKALLDSWQDLLWLEQALLGRFCVGGVFESSPAFRD